MARLAFLSEKREFAIKKLSLYLINISHSAVHCRDGGKVTSLYGHGVDSDPDKLFIPIQFNAALRAQE